MVVGVAPSSLGANPIGTNSGNGRLRIPVTQQPYEPQFVRRANYVRVMAWLFPWYSRCFPLHVNRPSVLSLMYYNPCSMAIAQSFCLISRIPTQGRDALGGGMEGFVSSTL